MDLEADRPVTVLRFTKAELSFHRLQLWGGDAVIASFFDIFLSDDFDDSDNICVQASLY